MVDNLVDRFTPHAMTIRDECRAWMCAITDRLDLIADGVNQDSDRVERIIRLRPTFQQIGAGRAPIRLGSVPMGEDWHLTYWTALADENPVILLDSGDPAPGVGTLTGNVLATLSGTANVWQSGPGNGLIIPGGTDLYIGTGPMTANIHITAHLQFRVKQQPAPRRNVSAGFRAQAPDRLDAGQEVSDTQRHVGSWHPGVPVFGPTAPDRNHGASS